MKWKLAIICFGDETIEHFANTKKEILELMKNEIEIWKDFCEDLEFWKESHYENGVKFENLNFGFESQIKYVKFEISKI